MATTETYPVGALREALERTATDPDVDAVAKLRELKAIREEVNHLVGYADTLIGQLHLAEAGAALREAAGRDKLASDAEVREELIRRGMATPEQCDAMGLLSADEIDAREAEGSLAESAGDWYLYANGTAPTATNGTTSTINFTTSYDSAAEVEEAEPEEPVEEAVEQPEPEPEPEQPEPEPEPASPPLNEAVLLEAYTAADGDATSIVVSRDLELVARRIVESIPTDPNAEIGPLVGLLECQVDDSLPHGSWRLGGDASAG